MREAGSDVWSAPHERAAPKQAARHAAAHTGFDDIASATSLLAFRIGAGYSTRLAPSIRGYLVRNAAHDGSCIRQLRILKDRPPGSPPSSGIMPDAAHPRSSD